MSERTFARVFAAETQFTPAAYVERLRIDAARRSLETTKKSVKQIARALRLRHGRDDASRVSGVALGSTPLQYRSRFATPAVRESESLNLAR